MGSGWLGVVSAVGRGHVSTHGLHWIVVRCMCVCVGACVMRLNLLNSMAYNWHRPDRKAQQSKSGNWGKCKV